MQKKTYILTSGKHHGVDSEGNPKVYKQGDRIELTEEQSKGLVNKIIDPSAYGVSDDESARLRQRIAELEEENEQLKEAVSDDEE